MSARGYIASLPVKETFRALDLFSIKLWDCETVLNKSDIREYYENNIFCNIPYCILKENLMSMLISCRLFVLMSTITKRWNLRAMQWRFAQDVEVSMYTQKLQNHE